MGNHSVRITNEKIYINGRFLTQQTSGVQTFARGICKELIASGSDVCILLPEKSERVEPVFETLVERSGNWSGHCWEQFHLPRIIHSKSGVPLLSLCNTGPVFLTNQVVTIHDLAFIKNPAWFHPAFSTWYRVMVPMLISKSRKVITVSESVKQELVQHFKIYSDKIVVVANKVPEELLHAEAIPSSDERIRKNSFFLMVGSDDPRKNFLFAETFFSHKMPQHLLVIAGGKSKGFRKSEHVASGNIIQTGYTSFGELKWLYQNATALINPSKYEGFGIPNLEAMAFDCPVICSDIPVFREVCAGAAVYFDPSSVESLQNAIETILKNKKLTGINTMTGKSIFTELQARNRTGTILKALFQ